MLPQSIKRLFQLKQSRTYVPTQKKLNEERRMPKTNRT